MSGNVQKNGFNHFMREELFRSEAPRRTFLSMEKRFQASASVAEASSREIFSQRISQRNRTDRSLPRLTRRRVTRVEEGQTASLFDRMSARQAPQQGRVNPNARRRGFDTPQASSNRQSSRIKRPEYGVGGTTGRARAENSEDLQRALEVLRKPPVTQEERIEQRRKILEQRKKELIKIIGFTNPRENVTAIAQIRDAKRTLKNVLEELRAIKSKRQYENLKYANYDQFDYPREIVHAIYDFIESRREVVTLRLV